jgi:hypothetical protein
MYKTVRLHPVSFRNYLTAAPIVRQPDEKRGFKGVYGGKYSSGVYWEQTP